MLKQHSKTVITRETPRTVDYYGADFETTNPKAKKRRTTTDNLLTMENHGDIIDSGNNLTDDFTSMVYS